MERELKSALALDPVHPSNSAEFITIVIHFYRGELGRMTSWRNRIDQTSHWALAAAGAMLSVSLSSPSSHHGVLIFAMVLVYLMLHIEARRYRFFDVYRTRVRIIERRFFADVFAPQSRTISDSRASEEWLKELSETLRNPQFTISMREAMARRLSRNYIWIFMIILLAWVLKTSSEMLQFQGKAGELFHYTAGTLATNARIGIFSGWLVIAGIVALYSRMFYIMLKFNKPRGELIHGEVHV